MNIIYIDLIARIYHYYFNSSYWSMDFYMIFFFNKFDSLFYSLQSEPRGSYWGMHLHMFYNVFIIQCHLCCRISILFFFFSKLSILTLLQHCKWDPILKCHLLSIKVLNMCIESFLEVLFFQYVHTTFLGMKALKSGTSAVVQLLSYVVSLYIVCTPFNSAWCLCCTLCLAGTKFYTYCVYITVFLSFIE